MLQSDPTSLLASGSYAFARAASSAAGSPSSSVTISAADGRADDFCDRHEFTRSATPGGQSAGTLQQKWRHPYNASSSSVVCLAPVQKLLKSSSLERRSALSDQHFDSSALSMTKEQSPQGSHATTVGRLARDELPQDHAIAAAKQ